ncbi:DUF134 domain-containing protein [bacterium]|nr:DUF134 domain-containing protein [bacterium]MBT6831482.1 DUF134 domain-containing protein [bacterium]MBT6996507.1 DUF134 domain-containing protein [bacterium]MBT7772715.1 DUF134 domain-containing protein [bacterium]
MPRPRGRRRVDFNHGKKFFKPAGISLSQLQISKISHEEIEALRLRHVENLDQVSAAKKMNTSQSTFQRILSAAHKKISTALVQNQGIEIDDFSA